MRIKTDTGLGIKVNKEIKENLDELMRDKALREYLNRFGLKFFSKDNDTLFEDARCHRCSLKVASDMENIFSDKRLHQDFPLVDCNINNIEQPRLKLVRQNIDSLALDVDHFFVKEGVIEVHDGLKPLYTTIFLTKEDSLLVFTKTHSTNTTRTLDLRLHDNKPDVVFGLTATEYLDKAKSRIVPIPLHKMAEELGQDDLALVLYINNLATTKTIRSNPMPRKASINPPARGDYKPKEATKLPRVHYTLNNTGTLTREGITRHTESWLVTGHWRHLRSGNKTWIEPFIKGKGKPDKKVYKI